MIRGFAVVFAALLLGCGSPQLGGNAFNNVDYCPDGGCTECTVDDDCSVAVDCCNDTNLCMSRKDSVILCMMACPELEAPPAVGCFEGQCRCR